MIFFACYVSGMDRSNIAENKTHFRLQIFLEKQQTVWILESLLDCMYIAMPTQNGGDNHFWYVYM